MNRAFHRFPSSLFDNYRANYEDPVFDHRDYDFFVDENLPAGQIVGTVQATDLDPTVPNNKLTYAIVPDDGTFSVDPGSGLITTKRPLDRETKDLHELIAHVFDHGRERSRYWRIGGKGVYGVTHNLPTTAEVNEIQDDERVKSVAPPPYSSHYSSVCVI